MSQPIAFVEILSPDYERARAFYPDLFDRQVAADPQMGGYGRFAIFADPDGNQVDLWA